MPPLNGSIFLICDTLLLIPPKTATISLVFNMQIHKMDVLVIFAHIELRIATG